MSGPLRVCIGWDPREAVAYHVLAHSILMRSSVPVAIIPVRKDLLKGIYRRERGPTESTEFSLTRFLVPYLCGYEGRAIFMDCDMLCLADIADVIVNVSTDTEPRAVWVCKHDYIPCDETKFLGHVQTRYERKNWSSFMVFDNARCRALTPSYVNEATGLELHRFRWLRDEDIGSLPLEWNWLVGEYGEQRGRAKVLHFTNGGPWFNGFDGCDHADVWRAELDHMVRTVL